MIIFVLWNSIVISFMLLFLISKKVEIGRSIFTVLLFSLLTWFVFGNGITKYVFSLDIDEAVHTATQSEVTLDSNKNLDFKGFEPIEPISALDLNYQVHYSLKEPTYIIDYKNVDNVLVRFLTGWRKQVPIVTLYIPINLVMDYTLAEVDDEEVNLGDNLDLIINVNGDGDIVDVKKAD